MSWRTSCVTWTLIEQELDNSGFADVAQSVVTFDQIRAAALASFDSWDTLDCSYLTFVETSPGHCLDVGIHEKGGNANRIFFRQSGWIAEGAPWRSEEQIALTSVFHDIDTGEILDVDMEFNGEFFQLTTLESDPQADIQNALTHEIGHMLGVGHSSDPNSTMWESANNGEVFKRSLEDDDIDAVCTIYPLNEDPEMCLDSLGGLDTDCETAIQCDTVVDGLVSDCIFDETVCCCETAGGYGTCSWTSADSCNNAGHYSVIELNRSIGCPGSSPDPLSTCCCTLESDGAQCEWLNYSSCETAGGYPTSYRIISSDLCGPLSREESCQCAAPGGASTSLITRLLRLFEL